MRIPSMVFVLGVLLMAAPAPVVLAAQDIQADIDAASPGDTVIVNCVDSPHVLPAVLDVDKPLTLEGEAGCATPSGKPVIDLPHNIPAVGACTFVNVAADDVTLRNLHFSKSVTSGCSNLATDSYMVVMPSSSDGMTFPSTVPFGNLRVEDSVFEGGRRAIRVNTADSATIRTSGFVNQFRDSIFVSNQHAGTLTIEDNTFTGGTGRAVIFEGGPSTDLVAGVVRVLDNVADGRLTPMSAATRANFFLWNHWASPTDTVDLEVSGNAISNLTSAAIVIYFPGDFSKLSSIQITGNDIFTAGRGVVVDYRDGGTGVAAAGQIEVTDNAFCGLFSSAVGHSCITVGTEVVPICLLFPALPPPGATTAMFGPGPESMVASLNYDCDGRPATPTPTPAPSATPQAPTAAQVIDFRAEIGARGEVTLHWETALEQDILGFRVLRRQAPDGGWSPVHAAPIPARGGPTTGARYAIRDRPGQGTFVYRLEVLDAFGAPRSHGEIEALLNHARLFLPWAGR